MPDPDRPITMTSPSNQALEDQRLRALHDARQRVVELQSVRTYLQESGSPAALLSDIESLLAQALAREQSLIEQGKQPPPRPGRGRRWPRMVAGLLVLGSWADNGVLALLELALNRSLAM
jgi:hypothetical protein